MDLHGKKELPQRIERWFLSLSEFEFVVEYRKGEANSKADALSRTPVCESAADGVVMGVIDVMSGPSRVEREEGDVITLDVELGALPSVQLAAKYALGQTRTTALNLLRGGNSSQGTSSVRKHTSVSCRGRDDAGTGMEYGMNCEAPRRWTLR